MAIVTIILVPDPFPQDHFVRQFICVRSFGNRSMGVDGEPDENGRADGRPPDEEIPCSPLLHKSPPFGDLLNMTLFSRAGKNFDLSQSSIPFSDSTCLNPLVSPFRNEGRGAVPSLLKGGWGILFLLARLFDAI